MTTDQILNTFDPLLTAALERLSKFNRPEPKDMGRFFGPCFEAIARAADLDPAMLTNWLATQGPDTISRESITAFVRSLTEAPAATLEAARLRQAQLEAQIAAEKPLTARELVLQERGQVLGERSRDSIEAELFELRTGHIRTYKDGRWTYGAELPGIVMDCLSANNREAVLQRELDMRDCRAHGVEYHAPAKRTAGVVGYGISPR